MTDAQTVLLEPDVALGLFTCDYADRLDLYSSHVLVLMCSFVAPLLVAHFERDVWGGWKKIAADAGWLLRRLAKRSLLHPRADRTPDTEGPKIARKLTTTVY